jgi:hypothetical protein
LQLIIIKDFRDANFVEVHKKGNVIYLVNEKGLLSQKIGQIIREYSKEGNNGGRSKLHSGKQKTGRHVNG